MTGHLFNEDYYERGPEKKISCYSNYRWLPELTMPAVMTYIDYLGISPGESILDFGCAKGFYVKALRLLHRDAWGCDISSYAVSQADDQTRPYVRLSTDNNMVPFRKRFDYVIAKDVLEHMDVLSVELALARFRQLFPMNVFIIVPLAENGKYIIPEDELDLTHNIRFNREEWEELFNNNRWEVEEFNNNLPGIKNRQTSQYSNGVGFFRLRMI